MLNDADFTQFKHVYVFVGKTDLRKGIDGLATLVAISGLQQTVLRSKTDAMRSERTDLNYI
jgi:hypothetical protein